MRKLQEKNTITAIVEEINPQTAQKYLGNQAQNRRLSDKKVQEYAKMMTDDEWQLNGEPIIFGKSGKLIDGQHRLRAVIYANKSVKMLVVRGVDDICFDSIDSGKSRSLQDVFAANSIMNSQLVSSIVKKYSLLLSNPKCCFFRDYGHNTFSRKQMLETYFENSTIFDYAARVGAKYYTAMRLTSPANIGAMFAYLVLDKKHEADSVEEFFFYMFSKKELKESNLNAAYLVRQKIIDSALSEKRFEPKVMQNMFAIAWNAFINDKDVRRVSTSGEEIVEFE